MTAYLRRQTASILRQVGLRSAGRYDIAWVDGWQVPAVVAMPADRRTETAPNGVKTIYPPTKGRILAGKGWAIQQAL